MKIIHTSDWHLGKILFSHSMLTEQSHFINSFLKPLVLAEMPDVFVIAGDVFDRSIAPPDAIKLFDDFISFIAELGIPMLVITGNHDGRERITLGASILKQSGIYIATDIKSAFDPVVINSDGERFNFYLIPHFEPANAREFFENENIKGFSESYKVLTDRLCKNLDRGCINVAVSHCFMSGCSISDSESPIFIGASGEISASLFDCFNLTLLGHLHSPQKAGKNAYYSGSPIKYSFSEQNQNKGINIFEIKNGNIKHRFEKFAPLHDMRTVSGQFEELLENAKQQPSDDYIHIHLTDKKPIFMPLQRLRDYYPNILEMSTRLLAPPGEIISTPSKRNFTDPSELFKEFTSQICGEEAAPDDLELFEDIVSEVLT